MTTQNNATNIAYPRGTVSAVFKRSLGYHSLTMAEILDQNSMELRRRFMSAIAKKKAVPTVSRDSLTALTRRCLTITQGFVSQIVTYNAEDILEKVYDYFAASVGDDAAPLYTSMYLNILTSMHCLAVQKTELTKAMPFADPKSKAVSVHSELLPPLARPNGGSLYKTVLMESTLATSISQYTIAIQSLEKQYSTPYTTNHFRPALSSIITQCNSIFNAFTDLVWKAAKSLVIEEKAILHVVYYYMNHSQEVSPIGRKIDEITNYSNYFESDFSGLDNLDEKPSDEELRFFEGAVDQFTSSMSKTEIFNKVNTFVEFSRAFSCHHISDPRSIAGKIESYTSVGWATGVTPLSIRGYSVSAFAMNEYDKVNPVELSTDLNWMSNLFQSLSKLIRDEWLPYIEPTEVYPTDRIQNRLPDTKFYDDDLAKSIIKAITVAKADAVQIKGVDASSGKLILSYTVRRPVYIADSATTADFGLASTISSITTDDAEMSAVYIISEAFKEDYAGETRIAKPFLANAIFDKGNGITVCTAINKIARDYEATAPSKFTFKYVQPRLEDKTTLLSDRNLDSVGDYNLMLLSTTCLLRNSTGQKSTKPHTFRLTEVAPTCASELGANVIEVLKSGISAAKALAVDGQTLLSAPLVPETNKKILDCYRLILMQIPRPIYAYASRITNRRTLVKSKVTEERESAAYKALKAYNAAAIAAATMKLFGFDELHDFIVNVADTAYTSTMNDVKVLSV